MEKETPAPDAPAPDPEAPQNPPAPSKPPVPAAPAPPAALAVVTGKTEAEIALEKKLKDRELELAEKEDQLKQLKDLQTAAPRPEKKKHPIPKVFRTLLHDSADED